LHDNKVTLLILGLILAAFACPIALGKESAVIDAAGKFISFWDATQKLPLEQRVVRFHSEIVPIAPALYENDLFRYSREVMHEDVDKRIAQCIETFPQIRQRYEEVYQSISADMKLYRDRFCKHFPDFDPNVVDVYLAHSLGRSNAAAVPLSFIGFPKSNRTLFYLGIDMIATCNKYKNQEPFFDHEFFHVYHLQKYRLEKRFFSQLWYEGLAVYVSKELQPQATNAELQIDDTLIEQTKAKLPKLAHDINSILELTDPQLNFKYFNIASDEKSVPARSGYYVGYLAVKEIAKRASVKEMTGWQSERIIPELRKALEIVEHDYQ
jgi:hypothetical protein